MEREQAIKAIERLLGGVEAEASRPPGRVLHLEEIGRRWVVETGTGEGAGGEERRGHLFWLEREEVAGPRSFDTVLEARDAALRDEVLELYELWETGRLDEAVERLQPDIEWVEPAEAIGAQERRGRDGARQGITDWQDSFDSYRGEVRGIDVVDGRVLVEYVQRVRAGGSSVDLESQVFQVWEFRDGRPSRVAMYFDREQALNS